MIAPNWVQGPDLNRRPPGYEPDELPNCSTLRHIIVLNSYDLIILTYYKENVKSFFIISQTIVNSMPKNYFLYLTEHNNRAKIHYVVKCGCGGIGRRTRFRFRPVCDFIVDYGFSRFHI